MADIVGKYRGSHYICAPNPTLNTQSSLIMQKRILTILAFTTLLCSAYQSHAKVSSASVAPTQEIVPKKAHTFEPSRINYKRMGVKFLVHLILALVIPCLIESATCTAQNPDYTSAIILGIVSLIFSYLYNLCDMLVDSFFQPSGEFKVMPATQKEGGHAAL